MIDFFAHTLPSCRGSTLLNLFFGLKSSILFFQEKLIYFHFPARPDDFMVQTDLRINPAVVQMNREIQRRAAASDDFAPTELRPF
ncbi:MAG: hypothetical protein ACLQSR_03975 [Limisphaerales bacterium]